MSLEVVTVHRYITLMNNATTTVSMCNKQALTASCFNVTFTNLKKTSIISPKTLVKIFSLKKVMHVIKQLHYELVLHPLSLER